MRFLEFFQQAIHSGKTELTHKNTEKTKKTKRITESNKSKNNKKQEPTKKIRVEAKHSHRKRRKPSAHQNSKEDQRKDWSEVASRVLEFWRTTALYSHDFAAGFSFSFFLFSRRQHDPAKEHKSNESHSHAFFRCASKRSSHFFFSRCFLRLFSARGMRRGRKRSDSIYQEGDVKTGSSELPYRMRMSSCSLWSHLALFLIPDLIFLPFFVVFVSDRDWLLNIGWTRKRSRDSYERAERFSRTSPLHPPPPPAFVDVSLSHDHDDMMFPQQQQSLPLPSSSGSPVFLSPPPSMRMQQQQEQLLVFVLPLLLLSRLFLLLFLLLIVLFSFLLRWPLQAASLNHHPVRAFWLRPHQEEEEEAQESSLHPQNQSHHSMILFHSPPISPFITTHDHRLEKNLQKEEEEEEEEEVEEGRFRFNEDLVHFVLTLDLCHPYQHGQQIVHVLVRTERDFSSCSRSAAWNSLSVDIRRLDYRCRSARTLVFVYLLNASKYLRNPFLRVRNTESLSTCFPAIAEQTSSHPCSKDQIKSLFS